MEIAEQNQLTYGLIQKRGFHDLNAIISETALNIATMKAHREDQKQELKVEKDIMSVQKFQTNYVSRCCNLFFRFAYNVLRLPAVVDYE